MLQVICTTLRSCRKSKHSPDMEQFDMGTVKLEIFMA